VSAPERLVFLLQIAADELRLLQGTDARLFAQAMDEARVQSLDGDVELAERVDAFVARFGRLQDSRALGRPKRGAGPLGGQRTQ
jgi:hypothetical protein